MRDIYDTYARKVCAFFDFPQGVYDASKMSSAVMQLPFAEAHQVLDGSEIAKLPRLGQGVTLQSHVQRTFFDVISKTDLPLFLQTQPLMIERGELAELEHSREWKTLAVYLRQFDLEPCLVFRNQPQVLPSGEGWRAEFYMADVRILLMRETPTQWQG